MTDVSRTAYHEAGYAILVILSGLPLRWVTIRPSKKRLGYCRSDWSLMFPAIFDEHLASLLRIYYAGAVGEMVGTEDGWIPSCGWRPSNDQGAEDDMRKIEMLLQRIVRRRGEEYCNLVNQDAIIAETYALLIQPRHRRALDVLAHILLERVALKGSTVEMIVRDTIAFPPRDGCVMLPGVPFECWKAMAALSASYDEKQRGWWVPRCQLRQAIDIRDKALHFHCLREAEKTMDVSRLWKHEGR